MPIPKEAFAEAKLKLEALARKDAERRRTEELKNNLEGYIYATREKVYTVKISLTFLAFTLLFTICKQCLVFQIWGHK